MIREARLLASTFLVYLATLITPKDGPGWEKQGPAFKALADTLTD